MFGLLEQDRLGGHREDVLHFLVEISVFFIGLSFDERSHEVVGLGLVELICGEADECLLLGVPVEGKPIQPQ